MKYKSVVLTKRGGPEVLQVEEKTLRSPQNKEVQISIKACGVGRTDVAMRYGYYPFAPKIPFVPGYEIVGEITAIGSEVSQFKTGDLVAALTVYGGYSEFIILKEEDLISVPKDIAPEKAVSIILNYCTAYQILFRTLKVKKGDSVLITGASGGVGSALIDIGKHIELKMFGLSSLKKQDRLIEQGVIPIDYNSKTWTDKLSEFQPEGLDFVIDGIGGKYIDQGFKVLKPRGILAEYGYPNFLGMITGIIKINIRNLIPNSKKGAFYGISANYKKNKKLIHEDLIRLFEMLQSGKINPVISHKFHVLEAQSANKKLEEGNVIGKIVLVND